jgi:hypothetical protein
MNEVPKFSDEWFRLKELEISLCDGLNIDPLLVVEMKNHAINTHWPPNKSLYEVMPPTLLGWKHWLLLPMTYCSLLHRKKSTLLKPELLIIAMHQYLLAWNQWLLFSMTQSLHSPSLS